MKGFLKARLAVAVPLGFVLVASGLMAPPPALAITQANAISYVYDELGRLEAVVDPGASSNGIAKYSYDDVGNILSISRQSASVTTILDFHGKTGKVGNAVTIYGAGFSSTPSQDTVKFNGTTATVTSATVTQLVATVPSGATTGPISVTSPNGSATSAQTFTVAGANALTISSFSPTAGASGTSVLISGTNFDQAALARNNVLFNDLRAQVTAVTPTTLTVKVPPSATSGPITGQTERGQVTTTSDFMVPPQAYTPSDIERTVRTTIGASTTVTVSTAGKVVLVLFDGSKDQLVSFDVASSTMADVDYTVYDPFTRVLGQALLGTPGGFIDTMTLPTDGTYGVLVDPRYSETGSATFTIRDASESIGTITPGGPPVTATTSVPGQNARLTFSAAAGQRVSVQMTNDTFPPAGSTSRTLTEPRPRGSCWGFPRTS